MTNNLEAQIAHITITNIRVNWCSSCPVANKGGIDCATCNTQDRIDALQSIIDNEGE